MPARFVLAELVRAQGGIVGPYGGRVGVAAAAEERDLGFRRRAFEGLVLGQGDIVRVRVSAVAIPAAQSELAMDVGLESRHGRLEVAVELTVAVDAAVLLPESQERGEEGRRGEKANGAEDHVIILRASERCRSGRS